MPFTLMVEACVSACMPYSGNVQYKGKTSLIIWHKCRQSNGSERRGILTYIKVETNSGGFRKKDIYHLRFPFMHFYVFLCPGTMTTHAESINSDVQRGLDRHAQH